MIEVFHGKLLNIRPGHDIKLTSEWLRGKW